MSLRQLTYSGFSFIVILSLFLTKGQIFNVPDSQALYYTFSHTKLQAQNQKRISFFVLSSQVSDVLPFPPSFQLYTSEMQPLFRFLKSLCWENLRFSGLQGGKVAKTPQKEENAQLWCLAHLCNQCFKDRGKQLKILTGECQLFFKELWQNGKYCNYLLLNTPNRWCSIPLPTKKLGSSPDWKILSEPSTPNPVA